MAISSFWRALCHPPIRFRRPLPLSLIATLFLATSSSSSPSQLAENLYSHMLKCPNNPERTLATIATQLDSTCVYEVLRKCSVENQAQLGLKFFVWAGLQSNYRHSGYMYGKACKLYRIDRNPETITSLIEGYGVERYPVNVKMFRVIFRLCREAKADKQALWILRKMEEFGCRPDTTMYNVAIRLFCEKGNLDTALGLLQEMGTFTLYSDMITYIEMIKGFCKVGRVEDACELFKDMKSNGCAPNSVLYSALLDGICRSGSLTRALELLEAMEKEGGECSPNIITYTTVIQSFCEKGRSLEALCILDRMESFSCAPNRVTINTFLRGLCSQGCVDEAFKLVNRVAGGSCVSSGECYSSLVLSLLGINRLAEAEKLFCWMLTNSVKPDGLACSSIVRKLCKEGRFLDGFRSLQSVEKKGFLLSIDFDLYPLLLDGLYRERHLVEAAELASLMTEKRVPVKDTSTEALIAYLKGSEQIG